MPKWTVPGYTALKGLGSGGFGDVVLARHDASGTLVAIKYVRPDLLADPEFAELFRAEAQVLASLEDLDRFPDVHEHVVRKPDPDLPERLGGRLARRGADIQRRRRRWHGLRREHDPYRGP